MPGFDGTGPRGMGPMTGGGRGFCSPWGIGAFARYGAPPRVGYGYPFYGAPAGTPGWMPFTPQMSPEQELDFLRNQAQDMRRQLEQIEGRIKELQGEG